ncbi:DUF554 domain-containing protein [Aestuariimicrobium kwangyangense]|uniref:DUF554 domain-containing protein n=1 Tax=Aestuariimicrobium kwangyangense TaxID=396389 RepID=UPI000413E098|nr:DUF554 domain-containing protein [Aestuariimicrobium kwangyangense]
MLDSFMPVPLQAFVGFGTVANVGTIMLGTTVGLVIGHRLDERTRSTLIDLLGLFTLMTAVLSLLPAAGDRFSRAVSGQLALIVVLIGLAVGAVIGSLVGIEERIEQLGVWTRGLLARGGAAGDQDVVDRHRFVQAFLTSTLLFCVGPMTVLGSLSDGLGTGQHVLLTKALMDGVASIALASAMGAGVYLSAAGVLVVQGLLTAGGWWLGRLLDAAQIDSLSIAGGVILLGLGLRLLDIRQVRVADLTPGLVMAPLLFSLARLL